jgi:hypothetical protein
MDYKMNGLLGLLSPVVNGALSNGGILGRGLPRANYLGYPVRDPYQWEMDYFRANPNVAGMAAVDRAITFNPFTGLSQQQQGAVGLNEAYRLFMNDIGFKPDFHVTDEQRKFFDGTAYANSPEAMRQTILSRILSGDSSAGRYTFEQDSLARDLQNQARIRGRR